MKRPEITLNFFPRPTSKGRVSISVDILIEGEKYRLSTKVKCLEKEWHTPTKSIKGSPEKTELLKIMESDLRAIYAEHSRKHIYLSPKEVANIYTSKGESKSFEEIASEHMDFIELQQGKRYGKRSIETYSVYHKTFLNFLKKHESKKD